MTVDDKVWRDMSIETKQAPTTGNDGGLVVEVYSEWGQIEETKTTHSRRAPNTTLFV